MKAMQELINRVRKYMDGIGEQGNLGDLCDRAEAELMAQSDPQNDKNRVVPCKNYLDGSCKKTRKCIPGGYTCYQRK
jgi:hypothetical protein